MRSERLREHQEHQQEPNTNASANHKADGVDSVVAVTVTTSSATTTNTTQISTAVDNLYVKKDTISDYVQNDATPRQTSSYNDDEAINNVNDNIITISAVSINDYSLHPERHEELTQIPERNGNQHPLKKIFKLNKKAAGKASSSRAALNNNNTTTSEQKITSIWKFSYWISFQDNIADVYHRKGRRLNGLQLPLHPLQLFGWLVLCVFGFAAYSLLIPLFKDELHGPLYGLVTGLYIIHIVSHLAALLIDPADRELRRLHQNNRIVPEFDRAKHAHVIENGRCHLCNIGTSSPQTKHCSVCNKCVGKFDHHCKWLNHCIGSRNYVAFLMCVVSAVCATLVILAAVIAQLALYFTKPDWLSLWFDDNGGSPEVIELFSRSVGNDSTVTLYIVANDNFTEYVQPNVSTFGFGVDEIEDNSFFKFNSTTKNIVEHTTYLLNEMVNDTLQANDTINSALPPTIETMQNKGTHIENVIEENTTLNNSPNVSISGVALGNKIFLILIGCLGLLAAITAGLLLHLCFFHIYISFLGLTTYEYIRNHRQTQEANKAKYHAKDTQQIGDISNDDMSANNNPSKKTNTCAEIYFCSGVRHPKDVVLSTSRNGNETGLHSASNTHLKLHCCANSREYHQTAFKSYYMCSLLEETAIKSPLQIAYISADNATEFTQNLSTVEENADKHVKTYHCCSSFAANTNKRRLSAAASKATLVDEVPEKSYLQYTEQCTLCTLRLPSPMIGKKLGRKYSTVATNNSKINHRNLPRTAPCTSQTSNAANQRCCMKSISNQQRWRRKWNCCTGVPDSPDVPNDLITALNIKHQREVASDQKNKATEIPVHFITTVSPNDETVGHNSRVHTNSPVLDTAHMKIPQNTAHHHTRTWPGTRLRNIMRIFNPYRRPRCRHQNFANCSLEDNLKQNQIRPFPLQLEVVQNGCQHHHFDVCKGGTYYDSSSPQPASSTTTVSEPSSEHSNFSDSSNLNTPTSKTLTTFKTSVLPTSIIRDDIAVTYTTPIGLILPPALPPPARRKIPNPTDLDELAETLGFPSHPSNNNNFLHSTQRLPALNSLYRRQRRKHFLRTRSPTLSPIHESGLSNPTSPQPCRHTVNSCTASPQVINKFCSMGSSESTRKTSSNCSLHSNSSSSSSSN